MQEKNHSFTELRTELLGKLADRGCTPITITGYRYLCNSIFTWLSDNGFDCTPRKQDTCFCSIISLSTEKISIISLFVQ